MEKMKGIRLARLLAFAAILLSAASCARFQDIKITSCSLGSVSIRGFNGADAVLNVEIDNPTMAFTVSDIDGAVIYAEADTAIFLKGGPVDVQRRCIQTYQVPVSATMGPSTSLLQLADVVSSGDYTGYDLDVTLTVSLKNGITRTVSLGRKPINELMENGFQGF